jgi:hypothetical protein
MIDVFVRLTHFPCRNRYVSSKAAKPSKSDYEKKSGGSSTEVINIAASNTPRNFGIAMYGYSTATATVAAVVVVQSCSAKTTCSGHGTCTSSGGCQCNAGWTGSNCNTQGSDSRVSFFFTQCDTKNQAAQFTIPLSTAPYSKADMFCGLPLGKAANVYFGDRVVEFGGVESGGVWPKWRLGAVAEVAGAKEAQHLALTYRKNKEGVPTTAVTYKSDGTTRTGSLALLFNLSNISANQNVRLEQKLTEVPPRVHVVNQQETNTPGVRFNHIQVSPGGWYTFSVDGVSTSSSQALWVGDNETSTDIAWSENADFPRLPTAVADRKWTSVQFRVPGGVTKICVGVLWFAGGTMKDAEMNIFAAKLVLLSTGGEAALWDNSLVTSTVTYGHDFMSVGTSWRFADIDKKHASVSHLNTTVAIYRHNTSGIDPGPRLDYNAGKRPVLGTMVSAKHPSSNETSSAACKLRCARTSGCAYFSYVLVNTVSCDAAFAIGDRVRVKSSVTTPKYSWGPISHGDIGTIVSIGSRLRVKFPAHSSWSADPQEMELVDCASTAAVATLPNCHLSSSIAKVQKNGKSETLSGSVGVTENKGVTTARYKVCPQATDCGGGSSACNGHGSCISGGDRCICNDGWAGCACNIQTCKAGCDYHGTCTHIAASSSSGSTCSKWISGSDADQTWTPTAGCTGTQTTNCQYSNCGSYNLCTLSNAWKTSTPLPSFAFSGKGSGSSKWWFKIQFSTATLLTGWSLGTARGYQVTAAHLEDDTGATVLGSSMIISSGSGYPDFIGTETTGERIFSKTWLTTSATIKVDDTSTTTYSEHKYQIYINKIRFQRSGAPCDALQPIRVAKLSLLPSLAVAAVARKSCALAQPRSKVNQATVWAVAKTSETGTVLLGGKFDGSRWRWNDGTLIASGYKNWDSGEGNDWNRISGAARPWLCMTKDTGKWRGCRGGGDGEIYDGVCDSSSPTCRCTSSVYSGETCEIKQACYPTRPRGSTCPSTCASCVVT